MKEVNNKNSCGSDKRVLGIGSVLCGNYGIVGLVNAKPSWVSLSRSILKCDKAFCEPNTCNDFVIIKDGSRSLCFASNSIDGDSQCLCTCLLLRGKFHLS